MSKELKTIADLEAKLAEKDTKLHEYIRCALEDYSDNTKEIIKLKKQLAEKEKELHYKNCECEKWKRDYENCSRLEKTISKERQYCLDNWRASEQDKISFAVEQLEKLKQLFIYNYNSEIECIDPYDNNCCLSLSTTLYNTTIDIFDKQIEELKKEINK